MELCSHTRPSQRCDTREMPWWGQVPLPRPLPRVEMELELWAWGVRASPRHCALDIWRVSPGI